MDEQRGTTLKFSEFNLESTLQQSVEKLNWQECTPIQSLAIPVLLEGKDVSGLAQTGTGKTAAFLLPLMERILRSRPLADEASEEQKKLSEARRFTDWRAQNFILILVPTRELAEQVYENIKKLSEFTGLRGAAVYGGTGYEKQKEALQNSFEFIVATPGRLIDLYKEHCVDLKQVRAIVFDEADRMFDMGFKDDMKYILQRVPQNRQFLVFSATLNFDVLNTAYQFGAEPFEIDISRDQAKAENVKDEIFHVGHFDKPQFLLSLLKEKNPRQTIVFSNFKMSVEKIASFLSANGVPAMGISSLLSQAQRNRVIELFKAENEKNILVATDVAARGLDIKGVDLVINYDLPNDAESYVHRIGRTGRAGTEGLALSLVGERDVEALARIEEYLKNKLPIGWLDDAALVKEFKPMTEVEARFEGNSDSGRRPSRPQGGGRDRHQKNDRRPNNHNNNRPHQGGAGGGPRPPRAEGASKGNGPRTGGPSHGRPRHQQGQDQKSGYQSRDRHQKNDNQRPHAQGGGSGSRHKNNQQNGQRPHQRPHQKSHQKSMMNKSKAVQPGVLNKVTGFLKRLFGD